MGIITGSNMQGSGEAAVTEVTLTASDTLTYIPGGNQYLNLRNASAGALTPNLVGDAAGTLSVAGTDGFDLSGGFTTASIGIGEVVQIRLSTIEKYLEGTTVTVTGGTAIEASLLEY